MQSPLLVAAEHVAWRQSLGAEIDDCVFECRVICGWHGVDFDASSATIDDVVQALALVWKHLDRTKHIYDPEA